MRQFTEEEAIQVLNSKHDCHVKKTIYGDKIIAMLPRNQRINDIGNKAWGKIDFLLKQCGYTLTIETLKKKRNGRVYHNGHSRSTRSRSYNLGKRTDSIPNWKKKGKQKEKVQGNVRRLRSTSKGAKARR